jgi:hypothetical protein
VVLESVLHRDKNPATITAQPLLLFWPEMTAARYDQPAAVDLSGNAARHMRGDFCLEVTSKKDSKNYFIWTYIFNL